MELMWILRQPVTRGALAGLLSAVVVDLHALTKFNNWSELWAYDFGRASFRWVVGAVTGAMAALGLQGVA